MFLRHAVPLAAMLVLGLTIGIAVADPSGAGTDISVRGLENAQHQLAALKDNQNAQKTLLALTVLQAVGKRQPPENGVSRFDYHVDVSPTGSVMINGVDVTALGQMLGQKKG
jgi:hypothetical protein